jgi:hypothetical protein
LELKRLVGVYKDSAWKKIAAHFGNRSDVQCRYHYQQVMRSALPSRLPNDQPVISAPNGPGKTFEELIEFVFSETADICIEPSLTAASGFSSFAGRQSLF